MRQSKLEKELKMEMIEYKSSKLLGNLIWEKELKQKKKRKYK